MSSLRATRLLNAVEVGSVNAAALEALLSDNQGRPGELRVLFNQRGQAQRVASNPAVVSTLVNSPTALAAVTDSQVLLAALSAVPSSRIAVRNAGNAILRRLLQSPQMKSEDYQAWPEQFQWLRQNLPALNNEEGSGAADNATWKAVTYGDNKYVVVAINSSACAVSTDGVVWTTGNLPVTGAWTSVAYGGPNGAKLFVAVARSSGAYATSADGTNWVIRQLPKIADWRSIVWRGTFFRVVALGSTEEAHSTDGINWTIVAGGATFTENLTVSGGSQGTPITLNLQNSGSATIPKGTTELNITGRGGAASLGAVTTFSVGTTQSVESGLTDPFAVAFLTYGNGVWIGGYNTYNATGGYGNSAYPNQLSQLLVRSVNGYDWTLIDPAILRGDNGGYEAGRKMGVYSMTFDPHSGKFIATDSGDHYHYTSTDGLNWLSWYGGLTSSPNGMAAGGGRIVAVYGPSGGVGGSGGAKQSTNDGLSFVNGTFTDSSWGGSTPGFNHVAYGNNRFVAISRAGVSGITTDGGNWVKGGNMPSIGSGIWGHLIFAGGYFVALAMSFSNNNTWATSNAIAYSTDGTSWTVGSLSSTRQWRSIGWHQGRFIANALSGHTCYASNPANWTEGGTAGRGMVPVMPADAPVSVSVPFLTPRNELVSNWNSYVSYDGMAWQRQRLVPGASASVTVNSQAYTYEGNAYNTNTPAARTDTIALNPANATVISYTAPNGTLVNATFLATDIQVPLVGTGSVSVPTGTSKLTITAKGAPGANATTVGIPNTSSEGKWSSPAYGNGKWVSVHSDINPANQHNVAVSPDGINWTTAEMPGGFKGWTDIAYGGSRFVAIRSADSGQVFAHSTDGVAWVIVQPTALAVAQAGRWTSITYGGGRFVAVGSGTTSNVVTSTDGATWSTANIAGGLKWNGVVYGGDRFVAVSNDVGANGVNNIAHSTDGQTWTRVGLTGNATLTFNNVAFGGSLYVAVGSRVATSPDGIAWTLQSALGYTLEDVTYGGGRFVASYASNTTAAPVYSTNGVSWTAGALSNATPVQSRYASIAYANNLFVAVATVNGQVAYSANAENWSTSTPPTTGVAATVTIFGITHTFPGSSGGQEPVLSTQEITLNTNNATTVTYVTPVGAVSGISYSGGASTQVVNTQATLQAWAYGNSRYVAIGVDGKVATSADGVAWQIAAMPANLQWNSVAYGAGRFVALAYDTSVAASSADGITWTQRAMPTSAKWGGLAIGEVAGNPRFLALSEFSTIIASSADGITWTQGAIPPLPASNIEAGTLTQVTLNGSGSVTVPAGVSSLTITGRGGAGVSAVTTPTYSGDGGTWTGSVSLPSGTYKSIAFGGGTFVAARSDNNVYTSSDGANWVQRTLTAGIAPNGLAYGGGRFVLVHNTGILYSADGITWTAGTGTTRGADSVVYGGGKFVAVRKHASANLSYSNDGIAWTEGSIVSGTGLWAEVAFGGGKWVAVNNLTTGNVAHSVDGMNWTVVNGPAKALLAITFGGGKFVALTEDGSAAHYSSDGVAWTNSTGFPSVSGGQDWRDITFGNGKYVVVGSAGRAAHSADAVNWTTVVAGHASSTWMVATWGNGRFVTAGSGANATTAISADVVSGSTEVTPAQPGANATVTVAGQPYIFTGSNTSATPAYTANTVVLNPSSSTIVDYAVPSGTAASISYIASAVAVTPVNPQLPLATSWIKAAFGNGTFVAIASGTNICATSPDAINWTQRVMPVNTAWASVRFVNGLFLAISSVSSIAATSTDGINWTQREMPQIASQGNGNAVTTQLVNNNTSTDVLSLKYNDTEVRYFPLMPDGTWITDQVASNGTRMVLRAQGGVFHTTDGVNLNRDSTAPSPNWGTIYYGDRGFVSTTSSNGGLNSSGNVVISKSADGITWTNVSTSVPSWSGGSSGQTHYLYPKSICSSPSRYVAIWSDTASVNGGVGAEDGETYYSSALRWSNDGVTWSSLIMPSEDTYGVGGMPGMWEHVTYGEGLFVAVRGRNQASLRIYTSPDGATWTQQTNPMSNMGSGLKARVKYVGGYFFLFSNQVYTETSGSTTTIYPGGGVLNGYRGSVQNGAIVWTPLNFPTIDYGTQTANIAFGNGKWMYFGDRGRSNTTGGNHRRTMQMFSTDGLNWTLVPQPEPVVTQRLGWDQGGYVNDRFVIYDVPSSTPTSAWPNRMRIAYRQTEAEDWVTSAQNTTGSVKVPAGVTAITLNGQGGTNNGGTDFVVKLRGVSYVFPGSTSGAAPTPKTYQITLDGSNQNEFTYTIKDGASASYSYTPIVTVYSHANWSDSVYGNGFTAAVARGGATAATTEDNLNWTLRTLPRTANWVGLAFGNGTMVAVAAGAYCATTVNGSSWAQRAMPNDLNWSAVAFGAGRFVAVSREPTKTQAAAHSVDGVTWTAINLPVAGEWVDITYRNNVFLAASANSNVVITSADGIIWTQRLLPSTANWSALATDGDRILGIANGSTTAFITFDGQNFNQSSSSGSGTLPGSGSTSRWNAVAFGNGLFVALAKDSSIAVVSADGVNWTAREMPSDSSWNCLTYGNGKFVALTENNTVAAYSADGLSWISTALPVSQRWMSVIAGNRGFVAISADSTVALSSRDGITWTARTMPANRKWVDVAFGNNLYLAVSENSADVATSADGITWTLQAAVSPGLLNVTFGNGLFVALCTNDAGVDVSADGINWIQCGLPELIDWSAVHFGNGVFVAVAKSSATVATSLDGVNWDVQVMPNVGNWRDLAYGNGLFVAITDTRVMATNC